MGSKLGRGEHKDQHPADVWGLSDPDMPCEAEEILIVANSGQPIDLETAQNLGRPLFNPTSGHEHPELSAIISLCGRCIGAICVNLTGEHLIESVSGIRHFETFGDSCHHSFGVELMQTYGQQ